MGLCNDILVGRFESVKIFTLNNQISLYKSIRVKQDDLTIGTVSGQISCICGLYSHTTMSRYDILTVFGALKAFKSNNQILLYTSI